METEPTDRHRQAYAYCAYCPKICRFACPVSESTHSETTSTWGKMTQAFLSTEGKRPLTGAGAQALYACTGCMRCRTFCKHQNEVGFALFAARQQAVDQRSAPSGALRTLQTFARSGNPFGEDLTETIAQFPVDRPARFAFFPGCSALIKNPKVVEDALALGQAWSMPLGVCKASGRCCGYPLYAAGDQRAFLAHAESVASALSAYPELLVLDPGCAYTLKVVYPRIGVKLSVKIRTLYSVLADHVRAMAEVPPLPIEAVYQDACHLGRGLGEYRPPRQLLSASVAQMYEARDKEEEGGCSGAGGLLPRTMPEAATDIAKRWAADVPGQAVIVTACPTSRRAFEKAGARAEDLIGVLRRWSEQR